MLNLAAFLLVLPLILAETNYTLSHRFVPVSPSSSLKPFTKRGVISIDPPSTTATFYPVAESVGLSDDEVEGDGWYQLGLEVDEEWILSSTRISQIDTKSPGNLTLHLSSKHIPTALHLSPSSSSSSGGHSSSTSRNAARRDPGFQQVVLKYPKKITGPSLAPPPAVDPSSGKPAAPIEEKTFLQKYWMPLVGIGLFVVTQLLPEPPEAAAKK
ncbi:hypothetical protein BCR39DRAFT_549995 [Naematelia encephala]|uniref:ER membrane protein complex subunit 10 n=1 Tax=Naematelia encephala TaxID=71784 RepID=A0A1Y2AKV9_9TREE|nr:hypothetical protein BCR39DRAFT_549995 [Naematelia encephala]